MSYEYQVSVAGVMYGMGDIQSVNITHPLFESLSVGNACSAELLMSFWPSVEPPRMAEIIPYEREAGQKEWHQLGIFYIDTRTRKRDLLTVIAYDAMLRSEELWPANFFGPFPITMVEAVDIACREMEVELDPRTSIDPAYSIDMLDSNDSIRDVLGFVASANGGNWIVTDEGKLLLVPLFGSMPPETHYLIDESGDAITLGGDRILI